MILQFVRARLTRAVVSVSGLWHIRHARGETFIRLHQRLWLTALIATLIWQIVWPTPLAFTALVTVGLLWLIGWRWARTMALKVSATRQLRYMAVQVGDELEETLTIDNRSGLPAIWTEIVDRSNAPGYSIGGVYVVGRRSTVHRREHTVCTRRGVFTLGPWELRLGDPFGLFEVRLGYTQQTEILVYPPLAELSPELLPHRRQVGDLQPLHQAIVADTLAATTTRPYVIGDPLRRVHWRTTARHADLYVKVFEPEASSTVWLLLDVDSAAHYGEGAESSLEKMIILAATLAAQLLSDRLAVGLMIDAETSQVVPPQAGQAQLWSILRALALARSLAQPIEQTLQQARSVISARDAIVVITPSLDPHWPHALHTLARRRSALGTEVIVIDPASFGGPGDVGAFAALLSEQGIPAQIVRREDIRPIAAAYGELRRWQFQTLGTGRVIARQTPRAASE